MGENFCVRLVRSRQSPRETAVTSRFRLRGSTRLSAESDHCFPTTPLADERGLIEETNDDWLPTALLVQWPSSGTKEGIPIRWVRIYPTFEALQASFFQKEFVQRRRRRVLEND
jgi:hypothetical protein